MRKPPSSDPTALGSILVAMSAVTPEQLAVAVELQERSSLEHLLGKLLVYDGYCSRENLDEALKIQGSLRSKSKAQQALGMADLARHSKMETAGAHRRIVERSVAVAKKATGQEHQVITSDMLAAAKPRKDY